MVAFNLVRGSMATATTSSNNNNTRKEHLHQQRKRLLAIVGLLVVVCHGMLRTSHLHFLQSSMTTNNSSSSTTATPGTTASTVSSRRGDDDPYRCKQLPETIQAYTQAVHDRAETHGLADSAMFPPMLDPAYLRHVLQGKRVALIGDSTLYYTTLWLDALASVASKDAPVLQNLSHTQNLTPAVDSIFSHFGLNSVLNQAQPAEFSRQYNNGTIVDDNNNNNRKASSTTNSTTATMTMSTKILWKGFNGPNMKHNRDFDTHVWPFVEAFQPDIVIANWGLHAYFRSGDAVRLCNVNQYVHLEEWMELVLQKALEMKTYVVLFKTSNQMCKDDETLRSTTSAICNATVKDWLENPESAGNFSITEADIKNYCHNGLLDMRSASYHLNRRMTAFVASAQQDPRYAHIRIDIFNDHDMQNCQSDKPSGQFDAVKRGTLYFDGRHYHRLQLPRIRLMLHIMQCLWNQQQRHEKSNYNGTTKS